MTSDARFALLGPDRCLRAEGVAAHVPLGDRESLSRLALDTLRDAEERTGAPGIVVGAVPFDPAEAPRLYIPEHVTRHPREHTGLAGSTSRADCPEPTDDAAYRAGVAEVVRRIVNGTLDKAVLARAVDITADSSVDVATLLERLAADNPSAYAYRVDLDDECASSLVGASPELLIEVEDGRLHSNPLAGSAPRHPDPDLDATRRDNLARSPKDLGEHAYVTASVEAALEPLSEELVVPSTPSVSSTRDLWHLSTTVTGRPRPGTTSLDLAFALHPTPAVCGVPRQVALGAIAELEAVTRGFYSGLVGWMDASGDGEWVIALRGGVVQGSVVRVHAGAGIVADSDPNLEHAETATKMRTFLRSLAEVAGPVRAHHPTSEAIPPC